MTLNFNSEEEYILEDERVLLRPLKPADVTHLLSIAINEPETWQYSSKSAAGEDGLKKYIAEAIVQRKAGKEYPFIAYDKQAGAYVGSSRFYDIQPENQCLQLGYTWYGKNFRGTGINKHCKFLLLHFAFETLGVERVEFRADARNDRSIAAMKSIGCKPEGIIRSHMLLKDGTRRDSIILSILKNEWFEEVKQRLEAKLNY